MNVFHDLSTLPNFKNAVLTIGSFDGVHCGHQRILAQLKELAKKTEGESVVITFHPHPRQVLLPDDHSLRLLSSIDEKVSLMEQNGVDNLVIVPFNKDFAKQSADEYIVHFLVKHFTPKYIVIGYDHRFGQNRVGDIEYLKKYRETYDFEVIEIKKQVVDKLAVSSTKVRQALEAGQIEQANNLLGYQYTMSGIVVEGQKIGRGIGFPTANLDIKNRYKLVPGEGIYAVNVEHQQNIYKGMLYIGKRPTLELWTNRTIEVNILDFDQNIYGDKLKLTFVKKIRGDKQFKSMEALKTQIEKDRVKTLQVFDNINSKEKQNGYNSDTPDQIAKVAVVLLNYNGRNWLEKFLPSVLDSTYPHTTIYIADNGSTDDSLQFLKERYPEVKTVIMEKNHGFAGGYNESLQQIEEEDYFVLLNTDVAVTPGWIDPIIKLMESDKTIGACQPKVKSEKEPTLFEHAGAAGGWMDYFGYPFCRGRIFNVVEEDKGQYDKAEEVFWASGAALFIRSQLFQQIGGFDASFFAHMEEIDLCWRIKRAGYKVMVEPASEVFHVGGGTLDYENPRKVYLNFRNTLTMLLKNESTTKLRWFIPYRLILDGVAAAMFLTQGKWINVKAIFNAHWSFFGSISEIWKQRKYYNELIQKVSISPTPNQSGLYRKSIIWAFYIQGRKTFKKLKF